MIDPTDILIAYVAGAACGLLPCLALLWVRSIGQARAARLEHRRWRAIHRAIR